jgi:hypothetical protein
MAPHSINRMPLLRLHCQRTGLQPSLRFLSHRHIRQKYCCSNCTTLSLASATDSANLSDVSNALRSPIIRFSMASTSSSRSLLERISPRSVNDPWPHDRDATEEAFRPRPRKPKRKPEPEVDPEHIYTPWVDSMKVRGDESKTQRSVLPILCIILVLL